MPQDLEPEQGEVIESRELGTIQIGPRIGKGGMGRVYEACRPNLPDARFAVKFLSPTLLEDGDAMERFSQEARRLSELSHRSIVRVQGYGLTKYGPCIVMELLHGESLSRLLGRFAGGVFPREIACLVITEVLEGLHHVHERGLVHRDIKPDNIILVTGPGEFGIKLVDFGIAKQRDALKRTAAGLLVGTPSAAAPEQCGSGAIGSWTDIYQVGVLAYQLLGRRHPFEEAVRAGMTEVIRAHLFENPPPLARFAPDVPAEVVGAVMAMLQKEPARRVLPGQDGRPDGSARGFRSVFRAYARQLESLSNLSSTTRDQRFAQMIVPSDVPPAPGAVTRASPAATDPSAPTPGASPSDATAGGRGPTVREGVRGRTPSVDAAATAAETPAAGPAPRTATMTYAVDPAALEPARAAAPGAPPMAATLPLASRPPPPMGARPARLAPQPLPPIAQPSYVSSTTAPGVKTAPGTPPRSSAAALLVLAGAVTLLAAAATAGGLLMHERRAAATGRAAGAEAPSAAETSPPAPIASGSASASASSSATVAPLPAVNAAPAVSAAPVVSAAPAVTPHPRPRPAPHTGAAASHTHSDALGI